jgi:hypothetical protein
MPNAVFIGSHNRLEDPATSRFHRFDSRKCIQSVDAFWIHFDVSRVG